MFTALAAFIYKRRWWTLAASALFLAASIAMIVRGGKLTGGTFGDGEAERTQRFVERVLGHPTDTTFVIVFHSDALDAQEEPFRIAMRAALAPVTGHPDVLSVLTPQDAPPTLALEMVNATAKSAIAMVMRASAPGAAAILAQVTELDRERAALVARLGTVGRAA